MPVLGFFAYQSVRSGNIAWCACVTLLLIHSPAIGNAFAVLSNPEKRLRYDEFGSDQEHVSTGQARHYNYYTEFEADITPEEIFNVFFGGHFPTGQYPTLSWKFLMVLVRGGNILVWQGVRLFDSWVGNVLIPAVAEDPSFWFCFYSLCCLKPAMVWEVK